MLTTSGLGSGLDINGLVTQLVAAEREGSDLQLARKNAKLNAKFSALGSLKSVLGTFQSSIATLNTASSFNQNIASSSAPTELTVSADSDAIANSYSVDINQLASSHALASTAFADSDSTALGTGVITIRFGSTDYTPGTDTYDGFVLNSESSVATIDIDSSNNTLEGIMTAINDADIGVNASIVNDGTGFRILMSSEATGEANSLEISVSDDDTNNSDTAGLSRFTFNSASTNMAQTAVAEDALLTINGLPVTSASNTVDTAIAGLTITLKQESTSTIEMNVAANLNPMINGIKTFISGYNQFVTTAKNLSSYDADKDVPAVLLGDFTLRSITGQIDKILRNAVENISGSVTSLAELGITTESTGTLVLDSARLNAALAENPQEIAQMFSAIGLADDPEVSFNGASEMTTVGNYAVEVSSLASAGFLSGAGVLPDFGGGGSLLIDTDNDNITLEIDGIEIGEITLTSGTYTSGSALADELQAQINGTTAMRDANSTVDVVYNSGTNSFDITSGSVGSFSTVNVLAVDINTVTDLGFDIGSGTEGNDVVGTIGGVAAVGTGNVLEGGIGSDAEGLSVVISGTTTGSRGNISFSRGLANQLDNLFENLLDEDGALEDRIDTYQDRIDDIAERKETLELRWAKVEERYRRQFNALDILLSGLQSTSSYLEGQFENLLKPDTGN